MTAETWSDRTILITGAAGGIGAACARQLDALGVSVILVDRDEAALRRVAATLRPDGAHRALAADLSEPGACRQLFDTTGELYGVVHMAGIYQADDLTPESRAVWDRTMSVNLDMAFDLASAAAPRLRAPDGRAARIVMAASLAYRRGSFDHLAYSASKGGIAGLTRALSRRLAPDVLVNAVAPGIIDTAMPAGLIAARGDALRREIPLGRWGSADEVAGTIVFLCSDAASYITGQIINIDGGMVNG
ncbi:hypothetical protein AKI39_07240 [Bordetella sp. H567]|uniref:SDR family NAD(P)-dependent oxidoreductase n=1 Tax=Bordetella sp. H567 TaxID=1697043 RepID=UPI00081C694D|nr:SDR family NAD(P)-dependent oxidoreductase [Bordetella sp. H567]AOB30527.1 hypothetical protein AKI39_07240 [Bordetella sp. H567]